MKENKTTSGLGLKTDNFGLFSASSVLVINLVSHTHTQFELNISCFNHTVIAIHSLGQHENNLVLCFYSS